MVDKHIRALLADHDCVIIPDFGGLITHYASARIHPVKHTFSPPSKKVAFNEKLKLSDGLLVSTIAQAQQIPLSDSQQLVAEFVQYMQQQLAKQRQYELKGIGIFRHNAEKKIEFEYIESENFLSTSFGLPELVSKPVLASEPLALRTRYKVRTPEKAAAGTAGFRGRIRKYTGVAASILLGGLTVSALYLFSAQNDHNLSSLNPFQSLRESGALFAAGEEAAVEHVALFTPDADFYKGLTEAEEKAEAEVLPAYQEEERQPSETGRTENEAFSGKVTGKTIEEQLVAEAAKPVAVPVTKAEVKAEKPAPKTEIKKIKTEAAGTIQAKTGRYYIISNAFASRENAEKSREALQKDGLPAKIIMPGSGVNLHRVSLMDFETREEALAKMHELEKNYGKTIWVLSY